MVYIKNNFKAFFCNLCFKVISKVNANLLLSEYSLSYKPTMF